MPELLLFFSPTSVVISQPASVGTFFGKASFLPHFQKQKQIIKVTLRRKCCLLGARQGCAPLRTGALRIQDGFSTPPQAGGLESVAQVPRQVWKAPGLRSLSMCAQCAARFASASCSSPVVGEVWLCHLRKGNVILFISLRSAEFQRLCSAADFLQSYFALGYILCCEIFKYIYPGLLYYKNMCFAKMLQTFKLFHVMLFRRVVFVFFSVKVYYFFSQILREFPKKFSR